MWSAPLLLYYFIYQVHSDTEWLYLLGFHPGELNITVLSFIKDYDY